MQHLGALGLTKERSDFPSLSAAFRCISRCEGGSEERKNRVGSKCWGVALRVGIQAQRFAQGFAANNALLWGARGMGKSALIKAVHATINQRLAGSPPFTPLKLVEIHREDIEELPALMGMLRGQAWRFLVFCDDLSFDGADASYKSLKAVLEGGIEGRPPNVLFYATSNRRHILSREMIENERGTAINPDETVQEKISLSDRFGLWLGFHSCSQDDYLAMVFGYADHFGLAGDRAAIGREALEWSVTRGARSGRTAWQFIQDLAGRLGKAVE